MKQDWEKQYFENCFKLKSGDNLTAKNMSENGSYPVFGGNGIAGYHNEFNLSGSNVIIGRVGALCGNVRHITENIWLTDNAFKIVDFKFDFDHSFLTYLLNYKDLRSFARQAAQPVISNSSLKDVVLQFPKSVKEQQRIVAILDESFAAITKAKDNAEQNLKNAKDLFESYLQGVFEKKGDGWEEKNLGKISELIDCLHITPKYVDDGYPMVRVTDIKSGFLNLSNTKKVDIETFKEFSKKHIPKIGDIVFSRVGSYGVSSFVNTNEPFCLGQNTVFIIPQIDSKYLYYFLNSSISKKQIDKMVAGTTQPTISLKSIKDIIVPIPNLTEQESIVQKLNELSAETKRLEAIYRQKLVNLEELKKSVLQKAFRGELNLTVCP